METLFEKLITTGGPSVVVVLCVWIMLKHMGEQAQLNRELFKEIHGEHLAARQESASAMRDMAQAINNCNGKFPRVA